MDHEAAVRTMAVERYLLDEVGPEEREVFEEHFFCCDECAQEIRLGSALMKHAREIFAQQAERPIVAVSRPKRDWLAWLRPAFAVPALALMLGVVAFQNLIQLPELRHSLVAMDGPSVLPNAYLASGSARGDDHVIDAKPGEQFQLTIDIPDNSNATHTAELYDARGRQLWSLPIPEEAPKEGLSLKMPGNLPAGGYVLAVTRSGGASEVSRYTFLLKRS
jgi:hypothetical protein